MEIGDITDKKKKLRQIGLKKKLYIFFVCIFISSLFWILIKLSREYSEVLKYPVNYTNIPPDKVIVNDLDSVFTLNLKSKGFKLLSNLLFFKPASIHVDVASLIKQRKISDKDYYIATSDLNQIIENQLHCKNNIISIKPDTIYIRMEKSFSKKLPVKIKFNLSYVQQYELSDSIRLEPDSVLAKGPLSVIDTIKFVETSPKTITNISNSQTVTLTFLPKYRNCKLTFFPSIEKVFIPVEKYTEASLEKHIIANNNINNSIIKTFPEKVKITYWVSLNNYKNIKPEMFSAAVNVSDIFSTKNKKLKVEVTEHPPFVKIRKIEPEKIEYILIK